MANLRRCNLKAVVIESHGGNEVLQYKDIELGILEEDKVKVEVKAASINYLDVWVRQGLPGMSLQLPLTMGSDASGIVVEVGKKVTQFTIGDEVVVQPGVYCGNCDYCTDGMENFCHNYGILGETENGVQAEEIIVNSRQLYTKATHLSFQEAASMPLVFMTAYQMLITRAKLKQDEVVLVYGGASGVGSAAIQIAKEKGAHVATTVGNDKKAQHAQEMGADIIVNHYDKDWISTLKSNGVSKFDVIFEHVGQATWASSMRLLAKGGRIVTCGGTTGPYVGFDLRHLFMKQQQIIGSTMSDIPTFNEVMAEINNGIYKPFIDKIFHMSEIKEAHHRLEAGNQIGKVVVVP